MQDPLEFSIQLPVRNDWRSVDLVRSSVQGCVAAALDPELARPDVAMVAAELLENAVKYGEWRGDGSFRIRVSGGPETTIVDVENPVGASVDEASEVFQVISWIRSFASTEEAYHARILAIATTEEAGASGLGLVRVAYEAGATLEAALDDGVLRVRATMSTRPPAAA